MLLMIMAHLYLDPQEPKYKGATIIKVFLNTLILCCTFILRSIRT